MAKDEPTGARDGAEAQSNDPFGVNAAAEVAASAPPKKIGLFDINI